MTEASQDQLADYYYDRNYDQECDKPLVNVHLVQRQHGTEVSVSGDSVSAVCAAYIEACNMTKGMEGYVGPKKGSPKDEGYKDKARKQQFAIKKNKRKRGEG